MTIFIILPVHNRSDKSVAFIGDIQRQSYQDFRLILMDDGCTDSTVDDCVRILGSKLEVVRGSGEWWWGGALAVGLCHVAKCRPRPNDVLMICNDDVRVGPDLLAKAYDVLQAQPRTLLFAECLSQQTGKVIDRGVHFDPRWFSFFSAGEGRVRNCCSTRGLFCHWRDVVRIGNFRPNRLPHYLSDYEWTIRAVRSGLAIVMDEAVKVHLDETTSGYQGITQERGRQFWRRYWSIKCPDNPRYLVRFASMCCPWPWRAAGLLRIWLRAALLISKAFR